MSGGAGFCTPAAAPVVGAALCCAMRSTKAAMKPTAKQRTHIVVATANTMNCGIDTPDVPGAVSAESPRSLTAPVCEPAATCGRECPGSGGQFVVSGTLGGGRFGHDARVSASEFSSLADDAAVAERLAEIQILTDARLAHLDVDDFLAELLTRVRDILDVDTVAVLTMAPGSTELVARAACGIEDEVRQGVRVRLGTGFAGRVAATKVPMLLDRVDETTVTNPILWEKGIKAMLGVPLLSGERAIGVLHVGRMAERPFDEHDIALLQIVADRISNAMQSRELMIERAATALLERSLLPSRLPDCRGLEFAARYAAAESHMVGGDWYDLFTVPSGRLWIIVGDVAGHGLHAAVVMGRIRSALRAYTMVESSPETVLRLVDRKVNHFEIDTMATVACAVSDPPFDTMTFALAGHPPPVVAAPGQAPALVDVAPSPPIGTRFERECRSVTVETPPGSVIAFYTDGLVERRGESLDVGLGRLLDATVPGPADRVAGTIMRRVIGDSSPRDDIALVVAHRTDEPDQD